jgi:hypothetical protein
MFTRNDRMAVSVFSAAAGVDESVTDDVVAIANDSNSDNAGQLFEPLQASPRAAHDTRRAAWDLSDKGVDNTFVLPAALFATV